MRIYAALWRFSLMLSLCLILTPVFADRIKDLVSVSGVRSNPLLGYGLVVGLDGSGDNNNFTNQSFKTMLMRLGIQLPPEVTATSKNVAAVAVHAELPAFAKPGQRIDVTVSSLGNAKSLRGGTLLLTSLKAANGDIYAVAQGNVVVSGFGAQANDGSKIKVNVPVVGRIPNGANVEIEAPTHLSKVGKITLLLHQPDFTTANRVVHAINVALGADTARALDAVAIDVCVPTKANARMDFLSQLENLSLEPGEGPAKIVVNSRTGTIVVGKNVRLGSAAVAHGNLVVSITETQKVSQPEAGSQGVTAFTDRSNIRITEDKPPLLLLHSGPTLNEVVQAINEVGASPSDLMSILDALQRSGALRADIEII